MSVKGTLVVIGGPTASGKTHVAVSLGKHFSTEVISADSRQFYRAMRIGTARPGEEELLGVPHHFLGHLELEQTWSAGEFARAAEPVLQRILERTGIALLVGGSGLYIDALLKGLDPLPAGDTRIRHQLQERFQKEGLHPLLEQLQELDEATWERIDRSNPHRVIRALEVCLSSGRPYSEQRTAPQDRTDVRIVRIAMEWSRKELYERIDQRVDRMIDDGLVDEARSLLPFREFNALRTVGYRELFGHFDGDLTREQAISAIKQHSRNYAKRQVTWTRRESTWNHLHPTDQKNMLQLIGAVDRGSHLDADQ